MTNALSDTTYRISEFRRQLALRGDLSWMLWEQQLPIYRAIRGLPPEVDEYVVLCARQFGKSHLGALLAVESAIRHRDRCIVIMGPDTKQTKDIVNPRMRRIQALLPEGLLVQSKSENKWLVYHDLDRRQKDFSEIVIGGMNENSSSQRGKTLQEAFIEEVVDANEDDYTEALRSDLGPALTHSIGGKIIFLTTLPKVPDHPFITDTLAQARLNGALAVFTIDDNKALTKDQYEAAVRRAGGRDSDDFKREYLCQVIRDSTAVVIPRFDEARHVRQLVIPPFTEWNIMVDWGGVRDYTVGLLYTYDFRRNKILFKDEFLFYENTPTNTVWEKIRRWMEDYAVSEERLWADAPGQTLVDLADLTGKSIALPSKGDWQAQINQLNIEFSLDRVEIAPSLEFTIQSLRSGIFNKQRTDFARTKALGHCDAIAAMMYAIRHFSAENPYPERFAPDSVFIPRREDEEDGAFAEAIMGRSFMEKRR